MDHDAGRPDESGPTRAEPAAGSGPERQEGRWALVGQPLPALLRRAVVPLVPPLVYAAARRVWHTKWAPGAPAWRTVARWPVTPTGWDDESVARIESEEWPRYVRMNSRTGVLGAEDEAVRAGAGVLSRHNVLMAHAYVLMLAAREAGGGTLSILDWGGNVGHFHLTAKAILRGVDIRYEVKDLPVICRAGRRLQPEVVFHEDDECLRCRYDLVMAMSSLQYSRDWRAVLTGLGAASSQYLFVSRLPTVFEHPSYLVCQRAYETEYVGWMINREELLAVASQTGLTLVREFFGGEEANVRGAPEQFEARAFLFRANGAS